MADDVRVIVDADARAVVVEAGKAKRAVVDLGDATRKAARDAKVYQDASGRWREENGRFVTSARKAELGLDGVSRAGERWTRVQAAGSAAGKRQAQTLHELGTAARRTTVAVGFLGAAVTTHLIKTGMAYEKQMSAVNAVTNASAKEFEQLKKQALEAGAATAYSASEAGKAQEELAKGGLSVKNILGGGLRSALDLAAAGSLELGEAAAITANAMNLFGINGKESAKVADALAVAANATTADVSDFGMALAQGGAVAKGVGLTFSETVVILEALAAAGVKNSDAGTSMKTALIQLVKPTAKQAELAKELGLSFIDANGEMRSMSDISAMLRDKLGEQGKAQRTATLATLAGTDGVRTLTALYDAGPKKLDAYAKGVEKAGYANEVGKKKLDNVAGAFEQLSGSIETVEARLFSKFQQPLKAALLEATSEISSKGKEVEEFFDRVFELPEFKSADVGGKLKILLEEFDKTGLPDKMRDMIAEGFANGLDAALPIVIEGAATLAVAGAKAFGKAFIEADPLSRVLMTGYLLHKTGALAAFKAYGKGAGAAVATGAAAGATGAAAAGGWKQSAAQMGKQFGIFAAISAAAAYGPEFVKNAKGEASSQTSGADNLPKIPKGSRVSSPKIPGLGVGPLGDMAFFKGLDVVVSRLDAVDDKLAHFGETAEDTFGKLKKAGDLRGMAELADQARKLGKEFPNVSAEMNRWADTVDRTAGSASDQFSIMRQAGGKNLRAISQAVADTTFEIRQRFGPDTSKAKDALSRNFMLAAQAIKKSMRDGKISTQTGMGEIEELFVKALSQYGFSRKEAINRARGKEFSGKSSPGGTTQTNAARGLIQVGKAGASGHDNVPAMLNGQPAVIAEGEQVAVFNRHQQAAMDARLADQGGLAGFFSRNQRPHYMARGGIVPIPGQPGESIHRSILPDVLRIISQYHARVTDGYATSGHAPGGEHPKGLAVDLVPGEGGSWEEIGKLANWAEPVQNRPRKPFRWVGWSGDPNHGPGNHLHLSWLAGAGLGGGMGGGAAEIRRVLMGGGDLGNVGALGQRALDVTRAAAQARLDSLAGGIGGEGVEVSSSGAEAKGDGSALMRQISKRYGWNFADWWALDAKETSHGRNLSNPTSSARLRGQFLDMNYGKYGPGSDPSKNPSMGQQIEAMAAYIKERYGNPTAAITHHNRMNWYAGGGIVGPKGKSKPKTTRSPARKSKQPAPAKVKGVKQLKYRGKVLDAVPQLAQIVSLEDQFERAENHHAQLERGFNLTDEERLSTDAAGNEVRNEPDIARRVGEIDQLIGQKQAAAKILEQQRDAAQIAAKSVAAAIKERQERVADILDAAKRNKRRIEDTQDDLNDERRGKGWQGKISANDKRIDSLQDDLRAESSKKKGSRSLKLSLRDQIDELQDENKRLRKTKPKGGDTARVKRLTTRLDHLRDEREELVGTRSVAKDAQMDGGMLASTQKGLASYREAADSAGPGLPGLADFLRKALPDSMTGIGFDILELQKERAEWEGTTAPAANLPSPDAAGDNGLADLLKQQLDAERERSRMLGQQFAVFSQFAPMVTGRIEGRFLHGAREIPRNMLAELHQGETVLPSDDGPFRQTRRDWLGGGSQSVQVTLMVDGDVAPLMRRVRAEVDGRAVKVVSEQLGRRSRIIASAPGGR